VYQFSVNVTVIRHYSQSCQSVLSSWISKTRRQSFEREIVRSAL